VRRVLILSGLAGWCLGVAHVDWQWALEHAQVMAGVVHYPPEHPLAAPHAACSRRAAIDERGRVARAASTKYTDGNRAAVRERQVGAMARGAGRRLVAGEPAVGEQTAAEGDDDGGNRRRLPPDGHFPPMPSITDRAPA
jgi:hypothetical protein